MPNNAAHNIIHLGGHYGHCWQDVSFMAVLHVVLSLQINIIIFIVVVVVIIFNLHDRVHTQLDSLEEFSKDSKTVFQVCTQIVGKWIQTLSFCTTQYTLLLFPRLSIALAFTSLTSAFCVVITALSTHVNSLT